MLAAVFAFAATIAPPAIAQATKAGARMRSQAAPTLARYVPRQDLAAYFEFQGLDSNAARWKNSATYKLLNETTFGAMLEDLIRQGADAALASSKAADKPTGEQVVALVEHVFRNGFVAGAFGKEKEMKGVVVIRRADSKAIRPIVAPLLASIGGPGAAPEKVKKGSREINRVKGGSWWFENGDLVIVPPPAEAADAVLAVLDGKAPNAVNHPIRAELLKAERGFEAVALGFVDFAAMPPLPPDAVKLGLDGVKRIDLRWGFQDDALMTVVRAIAPAPRRGIPALFDQPSLDLKSLPPIPADVHGFTALSVDMAKTYDKVIALMKGSDPAAAKRIEDAERNVREKTGLRLREDWLSHLGPKLAIFAKPAEQPRNGAPMMPGWPSELTVLVQTDDAVTLSKGIDRLMAQINDATQRGAKGPQGANSQGIRFDKINGPFRLGYAATIPPGTLPPGPFAAVKPTLLLGGKSLVISTTTEAASKALALEASGAKWSPTGAFKAMADRLPPKFLMLNVNDPRDTLPTIVQMVPMLLQNVQAARAAAAQARARAGQEGPPQGQPIGIDPAKVPNPQEMKARLFPGSFAVAVDEKEIRLVSRDSFPSVSSPAGAGVAIGLLLPAVQAAREAARRTQCMNNFRQIGLAMHNYESANGAFPPAAITDKAGKPLLSWRVAILPYVERFDLYQKFHLDEPWDSPHNKALIAEMPVVYRCPSDKKSEPGQTSYRVYQGPGAAFEGKQGQRIASFTDGTTNTVLVVETEDPVTWTKPDELPFDPKKNAPSALPTSPHPGGFNLLMGDGSVRFAKKTLDPDTFRKLITRQGGEVVPAEKMP
jgi:prepilin-type processing-associated H-X9-DG protein